MTEHPAVKIWRDTFKLNLNNGRKHDIVVTVAPDGEQGLKRWKALLEKWKANKWNPLKISWMLSEYERNGTAEKHNKPKQSVHRVSPEGVSGRHNW